MSFVILLYDEIIIIKIDFYLIADFNICKNRT